MDWTKSMAANLASSKEMYDYERNRMGMQSGMQASQIQQRQPDIIVNTPEPQAMPQMAAPTFNVSNTYSSNYEAPQYQAPTYQAPPTPQINLPQFNMPQMPDYTAYQRPDIQPAPAPAPAPTPQYQAPAPAPEPQQPEPQQPPKQEYHGNLGTDSGAFSQSWQQNWAKPPKIPW